MFNIFTNAEYVNGLMNRYEQINSGSVKVIHYEVGDDEGLKTFIDKFWKVGNDRYSKFFKAKDMLSSKLETIGVNTGNIFLSKEARIPDDETRTDMVNFTEWRKKKNLIEIQSDLSFKSITMMERPPFRLMMSYYRIVNYTSTIIIRFMTMFISLEVLSIIFRIT